MRRCLLIAERGSVLCALLIVSALYPEGARAQSSATTPDGPRVTVIGCVERPHPMTTETPATTVIPEGETRYMLSNLTLAAQPDRAGAAAGQSDLLTQEVKSYRLDDAADSMIAPHVGDRVEVTGVVVRKAPSPTGTAGTLGPESGLAPKLRVESLREISSKSTSCLK
jgi:hypothetical protein